MKSSCRRENQQYDSTDTMLRIAGNSRSSIRHCALAATLATLFAASAPAAAQSCDSPATLPSTPMPPLTGTTCGREQVSTSLCGGLADNPGPNFVIQFVLTSPAGHLMISGPDAFVPRMYLSSGDESCTSATCLASGDPFSAISFEGLPAGSYRLIIAAQPSDPADTCGVFSLVGDDAFYAGGSDVIFANGFD